MSSLVKSLMENERVCAVCEVVTAVALVVGAIAIPFVIIAIV